MSIHTIIRKINKEHPDPEVIREAGGILRAGGLVAFPTETVYGLGADALNEEAAKKIYAAKGRPSDNPLIIHITNMKDLERIVTEIPETKEQYYYSYDACDGRKSTGSAEACHRISLDVESGGSSTLSVVFSVERDFAEEQTRSAVDVAESVIQAMKEGRKKQELQSGLCDETARFLVKSAHQFVSRRKSTGGKTILAGFPFFEDWGRDTMIALPGVCLSTRQYEDARSILRTFARYERQGLMPNLAMKGTGLCRTCSRRGRVSPAIIRRMRRCFSLTVSGFTTGLHRMRRL